MKKKTTSIVFRFLFSGVIIVYFIFVLSKKSGSLSGGVSSFLDVFSNSYPLWILFAFSLHFVGIALMSYRWKALLDVHVKNARYRDLYMFNLMAAFFNNFLPSTIGGDIVKGFESEKFTGNKTVSLTVIFIERLTGMAALVLISVTAMMMKSVKPEMGEGKNNPILFIGLVLIVIFTIGIVSVPKINDIILKISGKILPEKISGIVSGAFLAIRVYYKYPGALFRSLLISLLFQFNMVLYYFFISKSIGENPDFVDFMVKAPILILLLMTLPSVNGIGVRTAVFNGLMRFPTPAALAVEAIDIALRMMLGLFGGIVYLFYKRDKNEPHKDG